MSGEKILKGIEDIDREELNQFLKDLRERRKKGYEIPVRTRKTNPYAGLKAEVVEQVLKELEKKGIVL